MNARSSIHDMRLPAFLTQVAIIALLSLCPHVSISAPAQEVKPSKPPANNLAARGKYLVDGVAVCGQCHTPRDSAGNLDRGRWLEGGPLWLQPAQPMSDWPLQAPRIAGSVPGTDAEMITLLTTGVWRDGKRLRPPMPQFRMSREDAEAVVAYLRSVATGSPAQ